MGAAAPIDDVILASGSYDHSIRIWSPVTGVCTRKLEHPDSQVNALAITPDKQLIAAAGFQHIRMYDLPTAGNNQNPLINYDNICKNVTAIGFQKDYNWMFSGGEDGCTRIWDLKQRNISAQRNLHIDQPVNSIALHPNQVELFVGDQSGCVHVWDLRYILSPERSISWQVEQDISIQHLSIEADGTHLATIDNKGSCYIYQLPSHGPRLKPQIKIRAHDKYGLKAYFSPDSTLLVTCSADCTAKLWRTADLLPMSLNTDADSQEGAGGSSSSEGLLGGGVGGPLATEPAGTLRNKLASIWPKSDVAQCVPVVVLKDKEQRWVWDAAFSADSQFVFTASSDNVIRLWNTVTGKWTREFSGHQKAVTAIAFVDSCI